MKTDSQLKHDVQEELKWEPSVNETGIGVAVHNSIVTLSGNVHSYAEKLAAEKAAKRVEGVKGVVEDITVKLIGSDKQTDEDLVQTAVNSLAWNSMVPKDKIFVKAEDGWLTLEGEVNWNFQREAAYKTVKSLKGVRGVANLVSIKANIHPSNVKESIRKTFERNAIIDANNIKVEVEGHRITLKGHVQSWAELNQANKAAWSVPGVWSVENELVVKPDKATSLSE